MEDPTFFTYGADSLMQRYEQLGDIELLDKAISLYRKALVRSTFPAHRYHALQDLAYSLSTRYIHTRKTEDLDESISLNREALAVRPPGDHDQSSSFNNLAASLVNRYTQFGRIEDLDESISLNRQALTLRPDGHPHRSSSLNNLAIGLSTRYTRLRKIEDLQESIFFDRKRLALQPPGHPARCTSLKNLAIGLGNQYVHTGKIEDLDESISLDREALSICPPDHHAQSSSFNNLAASLVNRYKLLRQMEDLDESISFNRQALTLRPTGHPLRTSSLTNLAIGLSLRYGRMGKLEDLQEAISLDREALTLRQPGHPDRSSSLNNLADDIRIRYEQLGKLEDLEESISLNRETLALRPVGHLDRSSSLHNLAFVLKTRYQQLGKIDDLEESISFNREALTLRPAGHPLRSSSLNNLANDHNLRYEQLGNIEDLEESISLHREGVTLRPPGHPDQSMSLHNLASVLSTRYAHLGKIEDLEESISLDRKALNLLPSGHPDQSSSIHNLADGLSILYQRFGKIEHLEESISLSRQALILHPPGHPNRSASLNNLANDLTTLYKRLGKIEDLEESISLNRQALALYQLYTAGHPLQSLSLNNLANALGTRYEKSGKVEDVEEMFLCYEQAATDTASYLKSRLVATMEWAQCARDHQHQTTLRAYTIALQLLERSLISRPDVEKQQEFLATGRILITRSLASDAASAAIQAGNLQLAVEFLEQGRAMLWSKIDGYKYPLEQLRQVEGGSDLADRLEILGAELEHLVLLSDRTVALEGEDTTRALSFDARVTRHRILSEEWDNIVGRIREKPDFAYFLQTPPFDTLQMAAADGPVIFVNISQYRSDAIILTINNPPILVPLPTIELVVLRKQVDRLTTNRGVIGVLRYLWENIVSPVVECLTELGVAEKSRIWWCPTAELCALPLHVAGPYRRGEENLHDLYTSSYISTLSSLIRARSNIVQPSTAPQLLVIGQHDTLPKVQEELGVITKGFGGGVDLLLGAQASHEAVLDSLKHHSWVHFACHGHLGDDDQPFHASFELHDGRRLTLLELIQARLPNAESAFLAACHSAAGDSRTPDENIHLSAALQFCGFRSVIGTLWEMFDEDGPTISKEFYTYMFRNPNRIDFRDSAHALNSAIRKMQKAKLPPERWVMFIHIGA